jgi:predicted DNA-binding transcriptional regulator YafY
MALLLHLQRTGGATAPALAEALEVSVRTVYRDVEALQEAGVPVWTEAGPRGGVRLVEGWSTRLDGLTGDEAAALFLAGAPAAAGELGLGAVLAAAQVKVLATLPPELRARAGRVRERFHLDAPGWFQRDEPPPPALADVAGALWDDRRITIGYRRGDRTLQREVAPLGLVLKAGVWYLVALAGSSPRTYRVDRIVELEVGTQRFERPAFDLASHWATSADDFTRAVLRTTVRVRLSPAAQRLLPHVVDREAALDALEAGPPADNDGWAEIELRVESDEVALGQLTSLGAGVEVVAPPALRAAMADVGRSMAARNASPAGAVERVERPPGGDEVVEQRRRRRRDRVAAGPRIEHEELAIEGVDDRHT